MSTYRDIVSEAVLQQYDLMMSRIALNTPLQKVWFLKGAFEVLLRTSIADASACKDRHYQSASEFIALVTEEHDRLVEEHFSNTGGDGI